MKKTQPTISTFASTKSTLITAIKAGIDHIILEDSKLSQRSFSNDFENSNFNKVAQLAKLAKAQKHDIKLSFNLDIIPLKKHYPLIKMALKTLKKANINTIRIQNPGLALFIKTYYPAATLTLATETGNLNSSSVNFYKDIFEVQSLSNELCYEEIKKISQTTSAKLEIQVHGPILIAQSPRHFISEHKNKNSKRHNTTPQPPLKRRIIDNDHPNKTLTFHENPHGNFILNFFDRSLIEHLPKLIDLNLKSWLIDARGETDQYLETAITAYKEELKNHQESPKEWQPNTQNLNSLKTIAKRQLKPGFFLKNKTDQILKPIVKHTQELTNHTQIGTVIDAIKNYCLTFELLKPIAINEELLLVTPEGKKVNFYPKQIYDLKRNKLTNSKDLKLVQVKWLKGIVPQTRVYLNT
jgi:U32 family peptidase